jgi:uncharacterized Tic20 family protein
MTEVLLAIFLLEIVYNVIFCTIKGWNDKKGYYFVDLQNKYQNRYIISVTAIITLIFLLGLVFRNFLLIKIILLLIVIIFGFSLYLDFNKRLHTPMDIINYFFNKKK